MGSRKKEDQQRVSVLLQDTVTLLCKNGLTFKKNMKIQGLLGITLDDEDVFIVHINEAMQNPDAVPDESDSPTKSSGRRTPTKRRRRRSSDSVNTPHSKSARRGESSDYNSDIQIKADPDAIVVDEIKIHDSDSDEGQSADAGLDFAISSIRSLDDPGGTAASDGVGSSFTPYSSSQPFVTGLVPNQSNIAEASQSSSNSSFAWDSNAAQGHAGMSGWSGQGAPQTMSQMSQQTMSQGGGQSYPPSGSSQQEGMLQPGSSLGSPGSARHGTGLHSKGGVNADCKSCQNFLLRSKVAVKRHVAKKRGIPAADWPTVPQVLKSSLHCKACMARKKYKAEKEKRRGNTARKASTPTPPGTTRATRQRKGGSGGQEKEEPYPTWTN